MLKSLCNTIFSASFLVFVSTGLAREPIDHKAPDKEVVTLASVTVLSIQPGPRMWKVSNGGHILWIIGTLSPVPDDLTWNTQYVESSMIGATEFLQAPQDKIKIGIFKTISVARAVYEAGKNPDHSTLSSVLPETMYLRWQKLWSMYGYGEGGMEKFRPNYARWELYRAALKKSGLVSSDTSVTKMLIRIAKRHDLKIVKPMLELDVPDVKGYLIGEMKVDDPGFACFGATLDLVQYDIENMRNRATEWSIGDIEKMQEIKLPNRFSCEKKYRVAMDDKYHTGNVKKRLMSLWLSAAKDSMRRNKITVAELPISELLEVGGYLSSLRDYGYEVSVVGAFNSEVHHPKD